jgi:hypothetical protein
MFEEWEQGKPVGWQLLSDNLEIEPVPERFKYLGTCETSGSPIPTLAPKENGVFYVYEVAEPTPIAFLAGNVLVQPRSKTLVDAFTDSLPPKSADPVVLDNGDTWLNPAPLNPADGAAVARETYDRLDLDVRSSRDQYVVVSYAYRRGWKAALDGTPVPVWRANGGMMAVKVPAGEHKLALRFYDEKMRTGLAVTLLPLVLMTAALGWRRARRKIAANHD